MKKLIIIVLMVVSLTVPAYAKKLPVKIGDAKITYKNGKVVKISYPDKRCYKFSYKGNKVKIKAKNIGFEEPNELYCIYKKGKITSEKYAMNSDWNVYTGLKYKKGKLIKTQTSIKGKYTNGMKVNGKIRTNKKGDWKKATFKAKDNNTFYGSITYKFKNKYKKGRLSYRKIKVIDKLYDREWSYVLRKEKYKYKNFKMSKKNYKRAKAVVRHFSNPLYTGGI